MQGLTVTLNELLALRYVSNQLHLPQKKISSGSQQGNSRSIFRGRGMDFVETRIYQPGDDIRTINWAVTARTGKPHTKIYQQERERPIYLVLDFSPSMFFGTRNAFKSVIAAKAATLIAWAGMQNGDRIGALLIKDSFQVIPPCHRKQNLILFLKQIIDFVDPRQQGISDYANAFKRLKKIIKSGSLIYFLSDFYSFDEALQTELQQLAKKNEVTNIFIYDVLEKNPPRNGQYLFHDFSKNESLLVDTTSHSLRSQYNKIFENRFNAIKKICFTTGMHLTELCTTDNIPNVIRKVLHKKM